MRLTGGQRGFSLIELLVAVFVIVLLTGVVSLNVGRGGAELALDGEVRHLSGLLAFASAEAGLSASDHGLFIARDSDMDSSGYEGIWLRRFEIVQLNFLRKVNKILYLILNILLSTH